MARQDLHRNCAHLFTIRNADVIFVVKEPSSEGARPPMRTCWPRRVLRRATRIQFGEPLNPVTVVKCVSRHSCVDDERFVALPKK